MPVTKKPYFANHKQPTRQACADAVSGLEQLHGTVVRGTYPSWQGADERKNCGDVPTVIEALISTILSQNTTNKNSTAAMASFLATFDGDLNLACGAGGEQIAKSIVMGGLAHVKGQRIAALLSSVKKDRGEISLEHLRDLDDEAAMAALMAYDGVGPKTASCVLLFCLHRDSFAVDTHVHRIAVRLGWVPATATREQAYHHLDAMVPPELKYRLHVLLVRHGKSCPECAAHGRPQRQPEGACPLHLLQTSAATKRTKRLRQVDKSRPTP